MDSKDVGFNHNHSNDESETRSNTNILDHHNDANLQKILNFGRELFQLSMKLDDKDNTNNVKMLRVRIKIHLDSKTRVIMTKKLFFFLFLKGRI